jgi:hypothetical protein
MLDHAEIIDILCRHLISKAFSSNFPYSILLTFFINPSRLISYSLNLDYNRWIASSLAFILAVRSRICSETRSAGTTTSCRLMFYVLEFKYTKSSSFWFSLWSLVAYDSRA